MTRQALRSIFTAAGLAIGIAACAGGSTPLTAPFGEGSSGVDAHHRKGTIEVRFLIPPRTARRHHLLTVSRAMRSRPHYVSPSTASITIVVNGNTSGATIVPVKCSSFPCVATATVSAPTGQSDTFAITAFDSKTPPQALSDGTVTQYIPLGITDVNVTLGGVVASISAINICATSNPGCGNAIVSGSTGSSQWTVSVQGAKDADNNSIVGDYDAPIELGLHETDISQDALSLSKTTLSSSSDSAQLAYSGQFDGEDAVSGSIVPQFCDSLGNPVTGCSSQVDYGTSLTAGYAVFETPCPSGAIACSTYSMYLDFLLGAYSGGIAEIGSTVYVDDYGTVFDSLTTAGLVSEIPANAYLIVPQGYGGPPQTLTVEAGTDDPAAIGGTIYFDEAGASIASFTPGSSNYVEYPNTTLSNGSDGGGAAGSDGNYYEGEQQATATEIAQFNPSTNAVTEFNFQTTDSEQWLTALGSNNWFAAGAASGSGKSLIGYMPVTQSPAKNVPGANEVTVGSLSGSDWWVINRIVAVPANSQVSQPLIFFDGADVNGTTQVIGSFNTVTHAVATYTLPSSWPANASLGPMAYSSVDGNVYFSDIFNGIIGRIPAANPGTGTIVGYGTAYNEHAGSDGTMMIDQSSGTVYVDSIIPVPHEAFAYFYGMTVLSPSTASWSSSPHAGTPAFKRPLTKKQLWDIFYHRGKHRGKGRMGFYRLT